MSGLVSGLDPTYEALQGARNLDVMQAELRGLQRPGTVAQRRSTQFSI